MNPDFIGSFYFDEHARVACPDCSQERRKQNQKDMTLTRLADGAVVYCCHHCGVTGSVQPKKERALSIVKAVAVVPKIATVQVSLQIHHYDWLLGRGISKFTADKAKLFSAEKYFGRAGKVADSIGFPYYVGGKMVSAKYRALQEKDFTQENGGAHDFFGIDEVKQGKPIIIVEGEVDALTLMEIGIENAVSVPAGAPIKVADGKVLPSEDKKFDYVWNAHAILDAAPLCHPCHRSGRSRPSVERRTGAADR